MASFYLKKLEINNFRSIIHQDFELREGLFVIVGDNKDTPGVTNGAGKTSLISAFFWAVTGCSLNGEEAKDDVINLKTGKNCKVRCTFDVDGDEVIIQRTRKDSELDNSLYFEINGQDMSCHKVTDTQARIDNYLKIPSSLLKSIIIMTSSMEARFSDLTNQGRIELLESIRDYSIWNKIRDESNKDIKDFTNQIAALESQINQTVGSINTYQTLIEGLQQKYLELQNQETSTALQTQITEEQAKIQEVKQKLSEIVIDDSKITDLETKVQQEQTAVIELTTQQQTEISQVNASKEAEKVSLTSQIDQHQTAITELNAQVSTINTNRSIASNNLALLEKWFTDDTCPTCNRKLERSEEEITTKTAEKDKLSAEVQAFNTQLETLQNSIQEKQGLINDVKTQIAGIDARYVEINQGINDKYTQQAQQHKDNMTAYQNEITSIRATNKQLADNKQALEAEKVRLEGSVSQLTLQLNSIAEKLEETIKQGKEYRQLVESLNQQIQNDKQTVEGINQDKEMVNFFYQQLGPKGALRPYLLSRDIVFLNACLKRYINKFFECTEAYLTVPTQEEKDIKIIFKNKSGLVTPVSSLSGGERKRLDLCIQLALYDLVQSTATFRINFVCFDEIESALDAAGIRALIDVIEERQEIIPTILWISNRDEVIECIKDKIVVTKVNGESEVHYE